MLGLFINTLTACDKYSPLNGDNLTQPIHMNFSLTGKTFSQVFSVFLTFRFNFEHFQGKDEPHS